MNLGENNNIQVPTEESINALPEVSISQRHWKLNPETKEYEYPKWVIWISEIVIGGKALFMPWGHIFHKECLLKWFEWSHKCPSWRLELATA